MFVFSYLVHRNFFPYMALTCKFLAIMEVKQQENFFQYKALTCKSLVTMEVKRQVRESPPIVSVFL